MLWLPPLLLGRRGSEGTQREVGTLSVARVGPNSTIHHLRGPGCAILSASCLSFSVFTCRPVPSPEWTLSEYELVTARIGVTTFTTVAGAPAQMRALVGTQKSCSVYTGHGSPVTLSLGRWRQGHQKLKIIIYYIVNVRQPGLHKACEAAWAT